MIKFICYLSVCMAMGYLAGYNYSLRTQLHTTQTVLKAQASLMQGKAVILSAEQMKVYTNYCK